MILGLSEAARSHGLSGVPIEVAKLPCTVVRLDGADEDSTWRIVAGDCPVDVLGHNLRFFFMWLSDT